MKHLTITAHAALRARQRGYRTEDLATLETLGTLYEQGIFMRRKDVELEIKRLDATLRRIRHARANGKSNRTRIEIEIVQEIDRLKKLGGTFIPTEGGHALSIYRPCARRLKHILGGRRRLKRDRRYWR
jgi:hypothetical protein